MKQSLAVTGSVNQHGRVQPIGAVNEKIEGFFDVCSARGLTGDQGVVIPAANVKHLMLRQDVVEAAAAGRFHVYAVETIDQAMALLAGLPAGEPDARRKLPGGQRELPGRCAPHGARAGAPGLCHHDGEGEEGARAEAPARAEEAARAPEDPRASDDLTGRCRD